MNAWVCDGCGAIARTHPVGWFLVREFIDKPEKVELFGPTGLADQQLYCSTDCIAAKYLLSSVEKAAS